MKRASSIGGALLALLFVTAVYAAGSPADGGGALAARLERVLGSRALRGARVSALVVRVDDGATLYEKEPDRALTPASNMKVLTGMAALSAFGPAYRFETPISADRAPDAEGRVGTLYVRGSGDPALNSEDWWRVAVELRSAGLAEVTGDLVLDDRAFDGARWHPGWGPVSSRAYHAPVGAIMANYGAFAVTVRAGTAPGDPARVEVAPPVDYLQVANRALTGARDERSTLVVGRAGRGGGLVVNVDGTVPLGSEPKTYYRSVLDPARYAGSILRLHLEALGISVKGATRTAPVPDDAFELLRFEGRPMAEIVRLFMKFSNNAVAEALVKAMGAQDGSVGSWDTGLRALKRHLGEKGVPLKGASIVDGSGLSYQNMLTPRTLVAALRAARSSFEIGPEFAAALPIAARDGTLEKRAAGADRDVRAKTGLLNRITALSGFARLPDGVVVAFSVLANGYRVSDDAAMGALDAFAEALVGD